MKKMLQVLVLSSFAVPATALGAFIDCDIRGGQPISCDGLYEGDAVMDDNGTYRECHFHEGKATRCSKAFAGRSIVVHEGLYKTCELSEGHVYRCAGWAQGKAPLFQADGKTTVSVLPRAQASVVARPEKAKPVKPAKGVRTAKLGKSKAGAKTAAVRRAPLPAS